jgi:DegT/DnrJ/EryC1/StrS aminotransferase family
VKRQLEREIEAAIGARTARACVFMPSGRFAMHVAFRLLLSPGDRVLMSPLEDDTVFVGALAAGLCPVMAPVSPDDGNACFEAADDDTWSSIAAALTGNLYGLPDRVVEVKARCDRLGIPLIEDAAHALETEVGGCPIGSFGAVSVFSLSKHIPGRGGILALNEGLDRCHAERLRNELMLPISATRRALRVVRPAAKSSLEALHLMRTADRARRLTRPIRPRAWRVPLRAPQLEEAVSGNDLGAFDPWMETAYADYRMQQRAGALKKTVASLRALKRDRTRRIEGVLRLRELEAVAPAAREGAPLALLRVPLLIENRDHVAMELRRRGINNNYVYAPPLDDYFGPAFAEPSPDPEAARWWATHALPIDPHDAERVLDLVTRNEVQLEPAALPARLGKAEPLPIS